MRILVAALIALISFSSWADGSFANRILLQPITSSSLYAGKSIYSFKLFDEKNKTNILDRDLTVSNTKKLHFIAYDAALKEFNHVHPDFDGKNWNVELTLPVDGNYFFWVQGQLDDGTEFSSATPAEVVGGYRAWPVESLGDHRKGSEESTIVEISDVNLISGKEALLTYKVTRADGLPPVLTPYLGTNAHVIVVSPHGDQMIHIHSMDGGSFDTGMLHITFPAPGDYRIWIQLIERNELKTIPLSVTVGQ